MTKESASQPAGDLPSGVLSGEAWEAALLESGRFSGRIALRNDRKALLARVAELEAKVRDLNAYIEAENRKALDDGLETVGVLLRGGDEVAALQAAAALDREAMEKALSRHCACDPECDLLTTCGLCAGIVARLAAHAEG